MPPPLDGAPMAAHPQDPDLTRPALNGVYYVADADLDRLAAHAQREQLAVCRIDLGDCRDRDGLFHRFAAALPAVPDFGNDWDALADRLRNFAWLPAWGHVLLFAQAAELHRHDRASFEVLLGVLDDAVSFATDDDRPCFAFIALPETDPSMPTQTLSFALDREFVKLDNLLKLTGITDSGGAAKHLIASGEVCVDGTVELRKTCKIHADQVVRFGDVEIHVTAAG